MIIKAKDGHRLSMNMLLENHYKMLYGYLLKMSMNEELTKDLTQETMIKAVTNIKKFRGDSKFSTWLIRIGINTYKNHVKKYKVTYITLDESLASQENVENQVIAKEQLARVNQVLNTLKPIDRVIFTLKYYQGHDYSYISELTGVKIGTCKSKVHYMIKKLKMEVDIG